MMIKINQTIFFFLFSISRWSICGRLFSFLGELLNTTFFFFKPTSDTEYDLIGAFFLFRPKFYSNFIFIPDMLEYSSSKQNSALLIVFVSSDIFSPNLISPILMLMPLFIIQVIPKFPSTSYSSSFVSSRFMSISFSSGFVFCFHILPLPKTYTPI